MMEEARHLKRVGAIAQRAHNHLPNRKPTMSTDMETDRLQESDRVGEKTAYLKAPDQSAAKT